MRALVLVLLLAACAHTPNLALRPEAAPAGEEVGTFVAADGTQLWQRHWLPTSPERGVLVIMHGLVDHSDNYDAFARKAIAAGFSVWAFDLRGHGRSAGPRVDPGSFEDYVDDLDRFLAKVHAAEPGQPMFLMGHSMGGTVAALTAIERRPPIAGLILSSAALNLGVPMLKVAGARLSGVLLPGLPALALDPADFSRTPTEAATMAADPLVSHDAGPAHTVGELAAATSRIWAGTDRLTMPLLVLHGTQDRLTAPSGSRALVEAAPAADKTLRLYDGAWHILLVEPIHELVETELLAWLGAHAGGTPVTAPPIDRTRPLGGDRRHSSQSIQLGGGLDHGFGRTNQVTNGVGELAIRLGKLTPVGWGGAGTVRYLGGAGWDAALMPIGLMVRPGDVAFGVATGVGTVGPGANLTSATAAWLELPLGPIHATASAQLDYILRGSPPMNAPLGADVFWFGLALRAPGDVHYWPGTSAGIGPYVQVGRLSVENLNSLQVTAGLEIYAAD